MTKLADPEVTFLATLGEELALFGPKTKTQVVDALTSILAAAEGVSRDAIDRALNWAKARADSDVEAAKKKPPAAGAPVDESPAAPLDL